MYMDNTDSFDHGFYTSFYDDIKHLKKSNVDSFEHWRKIGKEEGRVCSKNMYHKTMAELTSFDFEVYANSNLDFVKFANLGNDFQKIKDNERLSSVFVHFYEQNGVELNNKNMTNVSRKTPSPQVIPKNKIINLYVTNQLELNEYVDKWNNKFDILMKHSKFDWKFYWNMYSDVEAVNSMDLFKNWITKGIFNGRMHHKTDKIENLRVFVGELSREIDFDWEFFALKYKNILVQYDRTHLKLNKNLNDEVNAFCYYVNYARELKLCSNEAEHKEYVEKYTNQYSDTDEIIKNIKNKKTLVNNTKKYLDNCQKQKLTVYKYDLLNKYETISFFSSKYLSNMLSEQNIQLLNDAYCKNNISIDKTIMNLVKREILKFKKMNDDIMSTKAIEFILNIVYNGMIGQKTDNKVEYVELVKKTMTTIYKELKSDINKEQLNSLLNDVDYLITNKKVIKLTKMSAKLAIALLL
jgi:hypothetical protein